MLEVFWQASSTSECIYSSIHRLAFREFNSLPHFMCNSALSYENCMLDLYVNRREGDSQ